ncbi:MAG: WbqC family protein [Saprospiraceae bacterium]|nr:WbqC family protein [Saprospiraceae bacterium]
MLTSTESDKSVLVSLGYFPPVNWFMAIAKHPKVVLEQHEHYVKGSFRNRCQIIASGGSLRLSVPLRKGKNQQQPIREVEIAYDEPWQIRHWRAIRSAYGNSPFFEHYAHHFEGFFIAKKYGLLWDWNYDLFLVVNKILKLRNEVELSQSFERQPIGTFDARPEIEVQIIENQLVKYPQVFEDRLGFIANMSILDLIFCVGKLPQ